MEIENRSRVIDFRSYSAITGNDRLVTYLVESGFTEAPEIFVENRAASSDNLDVKGRMGKNMDPIDRDHLSETMKDKLKISDLETDKKILGIKAEIENSKNEIIRELGKFATKSDLRGYYITMFVVAIAIIGIVIGAITINQSQYLMLINKMR